jgi:hypothetical protein
MGFSFGGLLIARCTSGGIVRLVNFRSWDLVEGTTNSGVRGKTRGAKMMSATTAIQKRKEI